MPYTIRDKHGKVIGTANTPEEQRDITIMGLSLAAFVIIAVFIGALIFGVVMIFGGALALVWGVLPGPAL